MQNNDFKTTTLVRFTLIVFDHTHITLYCYGTCTNVVFFRINDYFEDKLFGIKRFVS